MQLVISDAHRGLTAAIARVGQGSAAASTRCATSSPPHGTSTATLAALIRTVDAKPDHDRVRAQLDDIVSQLEPFAPEVARHLADMADDLLAYTAFPPMHWPKMRSNDPSERLNREIKRQTNVVGIIPNTVCIIRLAEGLPSRPMTT